MSGPSLRAAILRSTPGLTEPRFQRARKTLEELGLNVLPVTWLRTADEQKQFSDSSQGQFRVVADYGQGVRNLINQLGFQFFLWKNLSKIKPEIVYACDLDTLVVACAWGVSHRVPVIYDQFDPFESRLTGHFLAALLGKLEGFVSRSATRRICANSERIPAKYRAKWFEIENSFCFSAPPKQHKFDKWTLFYGGVMQNDRGLLTVRDVISKQQSWALIACGYGPLFSELLNSSAQFQNIEIRGFLYHPSLMELASRSHLYLALYDPERIHNVQTASNKIFEAATLGIPIVTSKGTRLSALVDSFGLGWSVEYGNKSSIREALAERSQWTTEKEAQFLENCKIYLTTHDMAPRIARLQNDIVDLLGIGKDGE